MSGLRGGLMVGRMKERGWWLNSIIICYTP